MAFNFLVQAAKRRIIDELREAFSEHPSYTDIKITAQFPEEMRGQNIILVKSSSGSVNKLDPSNFIGPIESKVSLAKVGNHIGQSVEWVREDWNNVQNQPKPGVYYVEMLSSDEFVVDHLNLVNNEVLLQDSIGTFLLINTHIQLSDIQISFNNEPLIVNIDYDVIQDGIRKKLYFKKSFFDGTFTAKRISDDSQLYFGIELLFLKKTKTETICFDNKYHPKMNFQYQTNHGEIYTPTLKVYIDGELQKLGEDFFLQSPEIFYFQDIETSLINFTPQYVFVNSTTQFPKQGTLHFKHGDHASYPLGGEEYVNYTNKTIVSGVPAFVIQQPLTKPHQTGTKIEYINTGFPITKSTLTFRAPISKFSIVTVDYYYYERIPIDEIPVSIIFGEQTEFKLQYYPVLNDSLDLKINDKSYIPPYEYTILEELTESLQIGNTVVKIKSTLGFPVSGLIDIENEALEYISKNDTLKELYLLNPTLEKHFAGVDVALKESTYSFDNDSGIIRIFYPLPAGNKLSVSYRAPGHTLGPFPIQKNTGVNYAIPGVIIAFGNRLTPGDKQAIIVEKYYKIVGEEYGGKWELAFGIDVIGRSLMEQEEMADLVLHYLWHVRKGAFDSVGLAILDISLSGESTNVYDDNTSEQDFLASVDITFLCSWSIIIPYTIELKEVKFTKENTKLSPTYKLLNSPSTIHQTIGLPKIVNRLNQFEQLGFP